MSAYNQVFTDDHWTTLLKVVGDATTTLREVIKNLQDGTSSPPEGKNERHSFSMTRKPTMKILINRLVKVSMQLTSLQTQMHDMKDKAMYLEKKMKNQDDNTQLDVIQKVDDLTTTMQEALKRLQEDDDSKNSKRVSSTVSRASSVCKLSETEQFKLESLRQDVEMRKENERLKKELNEALSTLQNVNSSLEQMERYKEVIAKVTADNMVFLMKLKESEQALCIAQEEKANMTKQLETSRQKLLDQFSAGIEGTVIASLSKAESLEMELQVLKKDYEKRERELEVKRQEAREEHNHTAIVTQRVKELEEERLRLFSLLDSETKAKEEAQSKIQKLCHDVDSLNDQLATLRTEHTDELKSIQDKLKKMEAKELEVDELMLTLDRTTAQLETQQAINVVLMKKKEEMEWLFLEAKAEKENLQKQCRSLIHN